MKALMLCFLFTLISSNALGQMRPMFIGGPPSITHFNAISLQRHQSRTLRYREAIEELKKNPQAADVALCSPGTKAVDGACILPPSTSSSKLAPSTVVESTAEATPAKLSQAPIQPQSDMPSIIAGRRLALLIGNNNYKMPIPALETPLSDIARIGDVLHKRFGYETKLLKDAGKADTIAALNTLVSETLAGDSILIFYAGHGYQMTDTGMGFWIPPDATVKTARGWISNDDIARLLAAIPARQIILVSDSCFSGTLAKEKKIKSTDKLDREEILRRRSVLVMTSGDEEPVSDEGKDGHSIFAWNLIRTLEAAGEVTPGFEVWRSVHNGVRKEYPQEAQYGAVMSAGHDDGGEFIFAASK